MVTTQIRRMNEIKWHSKGNKTTTAFVKHWCISTLADERGIDFGNRKIKIDRQLMDGMGVAYNYSLRASLLNSSFQINKLRNSLILI